MRPINFLLLCSSLMFLACTDPAPASKAKPETVKISSSEILGNYLQQQFAIPIPQEPHYFVFIGNNSCIGCKKGGLHEYARLASRPDVTLLTSVNIEQRELWLQVQQPHRLLIDSTGLLDRLNLPIPTNTAIIATAQGKISHISSFGSTDYAPVFAQVFEPQQLQEDD